MLISMQPCGPGIAFPPGNGGTPGFSLSGPVFSRPLSRAHSLFAVLYQIGLSEASRQFPINIYIAFPFCFLARHGSPGWLRKIFLHLSNVPVGDWIPAFCWAVEKSGCSGLTSPDKVKAQNSTKTCKLDSVNADRIPCLLCWVFSAT